MCWRARGHEVGDGGAGGWEVEVLQGGHAAGEVEAVAEGFGEGFVGSDVGFVELAEDGPHNAAEPTGGELGSPGSFAAERLVDGDDAAHFEHGELGVFAGGVVVREDFEGGLHHFEAGAAGYGIEGVAAAGAFELAVESDGLAGVELVFEIGAVEPHALYGLERWLERGDARVRDARCDGWLE